MTMETIEAIVAVSVGGRSSGRPAAAETMIRLRNTHRSRTTFKRIIQFFELK